jgi:hypothetical protein
VQLSADELFTQPGVERGGGGGGGGGSVTGFIAAFLSYGLYGFR